MSSVNGAKPDQIVNPYQFGDPFEKEDVLMAKRIR